MKILFFGDVNITGGTITFYLRLIDLLSKDNTILPVLNGDDTDRIELRKRLLSHGITQFDKYYINKLIKKIEFYFHIISIKLHFEDFYTYLRDSILLGYYSCKYNPDCIIISSGGGTIYFPAFARKEPVIYIVHSLFHETSSYTKKKLSHSKFSTNKKLVFVSNAQRKAFSTIVSSPNLKKSFLTIPNYAQTPTMHSFDNNNKKIVLTLGSLESFKNPDLWLRIARIITSKYEDIKFIWAGTSDKLEYYQEKTKNNQNICFIGFCSNIPDLYMKSIIYLQPSVVETQGIAVIEAMSYKIPCIVSNVVGLPESVINNVSGFTCPANDVNCFVEKIETLLTNPELHNKMGEESYKIFISKFTKEIWDKSFSTAINEITSISK